MKDSKKINYKLILSEIRSGKRGRDRVIAFLYNDMELRDKVRVALYSRGGYDEDFDFVFNHSLMQFIKTVIKNDSLIITSTINNYIIGVSKYIWYNEIRKRNKNHHHNIDDYNDLAEEITPEKLIIDFNQKELIAKLLKNLGKNCKEVLLSWANGYKMKEIASMLGYKSEGMAKKKKHICLKELILYLDDNPRIKDILK